MNTFTEAPFSGKYWDHHDDGTYNCKHCGHPLFSSETKFDSNAGWPSFDETLPGATKERVDEDGVRIEISCAKCGTHLGHKFEGEGFTKRNVRHCINSVCLDFQPSSDR